MPKKTPVAPDDDNRKLEILALLGDPRPMQALLDNLRAQDISVDVATGLHDARQAFLGAGGHDCLVLAPDVAPSVATRVMKSLRAVDPELPAATFGPGYRGDDQRSRTAVLAGFHPGSRAGTGALLRFLAHIGRP